MSQTKSKIKKDDTVKVIAGKDKGHVGRVVRVVPGTDPNDTKVVVEGANRVKRHVKPTGERSGGIVTKEAPLHISKVAVWNAEENRRVKVGIRVETDADGNRKTTRVDKKTGNPIGKA
jgi:large subunit ribosomal protein L24